MSGFGMSDVIIFFAAVGICLAIAIIWVIMSERRGSILKNETKRLISQLESSEREKFIISERLSNPEAAMTSAADQNEACKKLRQKEEEAVFRLAKAAKENDALEKENRKLKSELAEARKSLEEVYKALN